MLKSINKVTLQGCLWVLLLWGAAVHAQTSPEIDIIRCVPYVEDSPVIGHKILVAGYSPAGSTTLHFNWRNSESGKVVFEIADFEEHDRAMFPYEMASSILSNISRTPEENSQLVRVIPPGSLVWVVILNTKLSETEVAGEIQATSRSERGISASQFVDTRKICMPSGSF